MDEPESLGAISLAAREGLDNLVFVVNCNLQRLDGPVRGNGKIIQELEAVFRGAGWNAIKIIWGSYWDTLYIRTKKACYNSAWRKSETAIIKPIAPTAALIFVSIFSANIRIKSNGRLYDG